MWAQINHGVTTPELVFYCVLLRTLCSSNLDEESLYLRCAVLSSSDLIIAARIGPCWWNEEDEEEEGKNKNKGKKNKEKMGPAGVTVMYLIETGLPW